jgi:AmmeMemoRadiSam system protein A
VQQSLLELARAALAVAVDEANASPLGRALETPLGGSEPAAVFVTLTEDGALRGCIGTVDPDRPLSEAVVASAINAALGDPRFRPVTAGELPAIHIEISVLGRPVPIVDPGAFEPGVDGVIVERNGRRALLLPEVATEFEWEASQMFDAVCRKAGLRAGAWHDHQTSLCSFRTIRFGGPAIPTDEAATRPARLAPDSVARARAGAIR